MVNICYSKFQISFIRNIVDYIKVKLFYYNNRESLDQAEAEAHVPLQLAYEGSAMIGTQKYIHWQIDFDMAFLMQNSQDERIKRNSPYAYWNYYGIQSSKHCGNILYWFDAETDDG